MIFSSWKSLLYKKYTLKSKIYQMIFIGSVVFFLCLLSIVPIQLNGNTPTRLSLTNLLSILVFFFASCGLLSGQLEINYHESRQVSLLVGNKSKAIIYVLAIDLLDCLLQSIVAFELVWCFGNVFQAGQELQALQMLSFILGACVFSFLAYFLTLCFSSTMISLALLMVFPLIIIPYLDRMIPSIVPLIFYRLISDCLNNSLLGLSHVYLFSWLSLVMMLMYIQYRKQA